MKKKHIIGLSTLLLVLLLGLSTTCYADTHVIWDDVKLKNILYHAYVSDFGTSGANALNVIANNESKIQDLVSQWQNNECIIVRNTNGMYYLCVCTSYCGPYVYSNRLYFNNINNCYYYRFNASDYNLQKMTNLNDLGSWSYNFDIYYTSIDIKQSNNVFKAAGTYSPSTFFDEWYFTNAAPFSFVSKPADVFADVYFFEDVPLFNASGEDLYIGQLFVPSDSNITYWTKDNYYYRYNDWNIRQLPSDSLYLDYYTTDNDVAVYDVYLKSNYIYENTIYSSVWADDSTEPYTLAIGNFYIKNNNTSVVNGVIDTSQTFSGDYKDKYDNDLQNQEDISNISEAITDTILDDSEVDNILGNFDTSGEVSAYFGYHDYTSDSDTIYYQPNFFITSVITDVIDELMRSGDRYYDLPLPNGGYQRISTRYFTTPIDGKGSAIIIMVRWILIFGSFYCMYRNFVEIGENLSTLNVHDVLNQVDEDRFIFRM